MSSLYIEWLSIVMLYGATASYVYSLRSKLQTSFTSAAACQTFQTHAEAIINSYLSLSFLT
jgi:hypothetical protein